MSMMGSEDNFGSSLPLFSFHLHGKPSFTCCHWTKEEAPLVIRRYDGIKKRPNCFSHKWNNTLKLPRVFSFREGKKKTQILDFLILNPLLMLDHNMALREVQKIDIKFHLTGYGPIYMSYFPQILWREIYQNPASALAPLCSCCVLSYIDGFGQKVSDSDKYMLLNKLPWIFWCMKICSLNFYDNFHTDV